MRKPKPIPQGLLDAVVYDPSSPTGLRWRERRIGPQRDDMQAGSVRNSSGGTRCSLKFEQSRYLTYRVVWALHHGDPGPLVVDHIDNDPLNNRIENLQAITHAENRARTTGRGYTWHPKSGKWCAKIRVGGKTRYLGLYVTEEEARAAYVAAKAQVTEGLEVDLA